MSRQRTFTNREAVRGRLYSEYSSAAVRQLRAGLLGQESRRAHSGGRRRRRRVALTATPIALSVYTSVAMTYFQALGRA